MRTGLIQGRLRSESGEWKRIPLSSLYSVKYGKANPGRPGNVPVVGSSGVYAWTENPLILHPSVVIGRKGNAGQAWLVEVPSYPSDTTFYLEPHDPTHTDIRFTYFALRYFQISASEDVIPSLQRHELENLILPFPPFPEQRIIAAVLSRIQVAMEVQDKIVATLKELKAATMAKLFREGLRGEPLKQTEFGEIPESWEVMRLGEVASIERGKFAHRPRNEPRFYGGAVPFIQTGDVAKCNGRIRTYTQTLNEDGLAISRLFPQGTIVLTIAANIADTGILEFDSAFPDSLVGITPDRTMDAVFLEYYLQTQKAEMDRLAPKGTQKNINIQFLKPWPTPRPSIDEQRKIAQSLRRLDERLEMASVKHDALKSLFSSMLHLLMTAQVRVNNLKAEEAGK